jgi:hypothetical protein
VMAPPAPPAATRAPVVDSPWAGGRLDAAPVSAAAPAAPPSPVESPQAGALGASNAAVAAAAQWAIPRHEVRPARKAPDLDFDTKGATTRPALRLVWFDPESVPRIRRVQRWKPILAALEGRPLDQDLDDPALEQDPMAAEDRREVFEILARADATDAAGVEGALQGAVRDDGKFIPPLVLVAGELEFPFDELESLKAAVSTASPLVTPADESLKAAVDAAKEFLKTPALSAPPQVSEGLLMRIREAFVKEKKSLPADHLDGQMERVLLTERHYQKRPLLGDAHIRFLLRVPGDEHPLIGYLPVKVAKQLPMFRRFRGRLVTEVHLVEDQYETQPSALRVVALMRVGPAKRYGSS